MICNSQCPENMVMKDQPIQENSSIWHFVSQLLPLLIQAQELKHAYQLPTKHSRVQPLCG